MEDFTKIRLEIEIMAQRVISQYMISNDAIAKQIEAGVKRAFEETDIEKLVENSVRHCIEKAIHDSADWGKISKIVHEKADEIIDGYVAKSMAAFKRDCNKKFK